MRISPKNPSSPSILTRRSMASLIESSRPDWTLTMYHFFLSGSPGGSSRAGAVPSVATAESSATSFWVPSSASSGSMGDQTWLPVEFLHLLIFAGGFLAGVEPQDADEWAAQDSPPRDIDAEEKDGHQDDRHEHHGRVLQQAPPARPGDFVKFGLGRDQEFGKRRHVDDAIAQPE